MTTPDLTQSALYPHWIENEVRYSDTDRQGHVNNVAFTTYLESGRVALIYAQSIPLDLEETSFVIARLLLDFRAEINWPGTVHIGTGVLRVGRSSLTLVQGLFVNKLCVATAETVIVMVNNATRKSHPLPDSVRAALQPLACRT